MGETWQTSPLSTKSPELIYSKLGQTEVLGLLMLHMSTHRFHDILPERQTLDLIVKKHQTNSNWETIIPENWPVLFQQVNIMKFKDRRRICSRLKETKEMRQFSALWDPALDPGQMTS